MDKKKMKDCPICGCPLKQENYASHLLKVHNEKVVEENKDEEEYHLPIDGNKGTSKRAKQRKMELIRKKRKAKIMMIGSVMLISVMCVVVYAVMSMNGNESIQNPEPAQESPVQSETEVRIPLSEISSAQFYSHQGNGVTIRYFAVKASDGDVRVAFDACDVCYNAKKGYTQIDDVMHCINCGNEYAITGLGTENVYGGCWPSYLPMDIDGDDVVIKISDLEEKAYMF
ncbi:MAG: DUF2318 domain-containing protein [Thermoplasmatales archaeon]|nr:MAG: DUF2318 domain-containing protein [Thermoplasmatales archaeon]